MSKSEKMTTMFYDGGCPLCSREVAHYRRIDLHQNVRWLDISEHPEHLEEYGVSHVAAMKHLHVLDQNGNMVRGAYAFHALWQALPRYRFLAKAASFPGILPIMNKVYEQFARRRFAKRLDCINDRNMARQGDQQRTKDPTRFEKST